ncbi:hypothetical protein Taro_011866 [Colocasia esculenta]|uniref:Uncharacterized protein n=1 Tax=Colocasia esculenta TaxID=4460 RepID=A0A843UB95_COLES|nr:hypothetical protein [Colocasia esculenta]
MSNGFSGMAATPKFVKSERIHPNEKNFQGSQQLSEDMKMWSDLEFGDGRNHGIADSVLSNRMSGFAAGPFFSSLQREVHGPRDHFTLWRPPDHRNPAKSHKRATSKGGRNRTLARHRTGRGRSEKGSGGGRREQEEKMRQFDPWPVFFRREWKRNWPFLVGFAVTGYIVTKFSLSLTEEDAKNSPFVQKHNR